MENYNPKCSAIDPSISAATFLDVPIDFALKVIDLLNDKDETVQEWKPMASVSYMLDEEDYRWYNKTLFKFIPFPIGSLEFAITCKHFLKIASSQLKSDLLWLDHYSSLHTDKCEILSDNIEEEHKELHIEPHHTNHCYPIHRILGWYKFALHGLKSLHLSHLVNSITNREAIELLNQMKIHSTPVEELILDSVINIRHGYDVDPEKYQVLEKALKIILPKIAPGLLALNFVINRSYISLVRNVICKISLPKIKYVKIEMKYDNIEDNIDDALHFLRHCHDSGASIEILQLFCSQKQLNSLPALLASCPHLHTLQLEGKHYHEIHFPFDPEMVVAKICKLKIVGLSLLNVEDVLEIARLNENMLDVNFEGCYVKKIEDIIAEMDHNGGRKVTAFQTPNILFPKAILDLSRCFPNLKRLELRGHHWDSWEVKEAVYKWKFLEEIVIRGQLEYESDRGSITKDFVPLLISSQAPLQMISLIDVAITPDDVCKILDKFKNSITRFQTYYTNFRRWVDERTRKINGLVGKFYDLKDVIRVYQHVLEKQEYPKLRDITFPYDLLSKSFLPEAEVHEIKELSEKLISTLPCFDGISMRKCLKPYKHEPAFRKYVKTF